VVEADISREPDDLPPPTARREPQSVRVDLLSVEVEGRLAEGTTFGYWTFNGKVPGLSSACASATPSTSI
jgi:nitrite reductase (NO-forming)